MMNGKPLANPALRFPLSTELENSLNTNTFIVTSRRVSHQVDEHFACRVYCAVFFSFFYYYCLMI